MITADELITQINAITTSEQVPVVFAQVETFFKENDLIADDQRVRDALGRKLKQIGEQSKALVDEFRDTLRLNGVDYPLTDWLTPTQYIKKFNIASVATITNWVARGVIPADHVKDIEQLGIRLIKAVPYEPRTYNKGA